MYFCFDYRDLESNEIEDIHADAFTPFTQLEDL
jgi:hypothetical protein